MWCFTHILNLIANGELDAINSSVEKIQNSVAYWLATPKRIKKFIEYSCQMNVCYDKKKKVSIWLKN